MLVIKRLQYFSSPGNNEYVKSFLKANLKFDGFVRLEYSTLRKRTIRVASE